MPRFSPLSRLLAVSLSCLVFASAMTAQTPKKEEGPPPRVVDDGKKGPGKTELKPVPIPEEPKKEAPKIKVDVVPPPVKKVEEPKKVEELKKEEPAKKVEEPKKDEPKKEEGKEEPKKEEPKADPLADVKALAQKGVDDAGAAKKLGDNAWVLVSTAFVFLMTPGLALFYGGMVRKKNVLATMMQSYASLAIVGLYWVAFGYGLAFGPSQVIAPEWLSGFFGDDAKGGGIIGWEWKLFFLQGVSPTDYLPGYNIPVFTHVLFQGMFAIITPALISGAVAERIRFWPWTIFMIIWVTVVYCPLAHMVWAFDWFAVDPATAGKDIGVTAIGLLGKAGALDFAGGTVVHIAAGFAGLACIFVLRKRKGYPEHPMHPNSMVLTLIGAGLLWFGWFGFNGGSSLSSNDLGTTGFATTQAAAAAAGLSWMIVEWIFKGKPTALGLASGIVAGLVAVTPASGFVYMWGGAAIGAIAGVVCYLSVQLKSMLGYDDSLDAFGVHGVGGFLGAVLTGVFCYAAIQGASKDGYFAISNFEKNIASLKAEKETLEKDIKAIEKTGPDLEKKAKDAADKVATGKDDKEKETLQKAADEAKLEFEEVVKKIGRRTDRIGKIGSLKDATKPDDKGSGEIASYSDKIDALKKDGKNSLTQTIIQLKASVFSAVLAFFATIVIALFVQIITGGNFTTSEKDESDGLDQTEHGETGFDFGGIDMLSATTGKEPKSAKIPPGGKRFEVVIEGVENGGLMHAWSELCQPKDGPIDPDFKAIYPYVTTVQGNRFRLRGGDPKTLSLNIQRLFQKKLGKALKVRVEE